MKIVNKLVNACIFLPFLIALLMPVNSEVMCGDNVMYGDNVLGCPLTISVTPTTVTTTTLVGGGGAGGQVGTTPTTLPQASAEPTSDINPFDIVIPVVIAVSSRFIYSALKNGN